MRACYGARMRGKDRGQQSAAAILSVLAFGVLGAGCAGPRETIVIYPGLLQQAGSPDGARVAGPLDCDDGIPARSGNTLFCFDPRPRTWEDARVACMARGGDLAYIASSDEAAAINDAFGAHLQVPAALAFGLSEPVNEGEWRWASGEPLSFRSWAPGEPNDMGGEDCAQWITTTGQWNDIDCRTPQGYVCEAPPGATRQIACEDVVVEIGEQRYCIHRQSQLAPTMAEQACRADGGRLAEFDTAEKNAAFLAAIAPRGGVRNDVWIGITDRAHEGDWRTPAGDPLPFTAWRPGEPNNAGGAENCATWGPTDGEWNDLPCTGVTGSICRGSVE